MGSEGRRSAAYRHTRTLYQTGNYPCWLATGPWCTGRGTTVEHDPPLSTAPNITVWEMWRTTGQAHYRPACPPCQHRQGARITNQRTTWTW